MALTFRTRLSGPVTWCASRTSTSSAARALRRAKCCSGALTRMIALTAKPELLRIELGPVARDDPRVLEAADALGRGGRREADPPAQLAEREASVGLERGEDAPAHVVERAFHPESHGQRIPQDSRNRPRDSFDRLWIPRTDESVVARGSNGGDGHAERARSESSTRACAGWSTRSPCSTTRPTCRARRRRPSARCSKRSRAASTACTSRCLRSSGTRRARSAVGIARTRRSS